MSARITIERILRDADDAGGQSIRSWHIQRDGNFLIIRAKEDHPFIMIGIADAQQFCDDLQRMAGDFE